MQTQKTLDQKIEGYLGMTYWQYTDDCKKLFVNPLSWSEWRLAILKTLYEGSPEEYTKLLAWGQ